MKKLFILTYIVIINGCSNIGNLELLNDTNAQTTREFFHTMSKTNSVLYGNSNPNNMSPINRVYGNINNSNFSVRESSDIPYVFQNIQDTTKYFK